MSDDRLRDGMAVLEQAEPDDRADLDGDVEREFGFDQLAGGARARGGLAEHDDAVALRQHLGHHEPFGNDQRADLAIEIGGTGLPGPAADPRDTIDRTGNVPVDIVGHRFGDAFGLVARGSPAEEFLDSR